MREVSPPEIKIMKQTEMDKRETWGPYNIKIMKQNGVRKRERSGFRE